MSGSLDKELELLHAYADGELSPRQRHDVESYLEQCPLAQRRLRDYQSLRDELKQLYGPVAAEPIPSSIRRFSRQNSWRSSFAATAAGILLLTGAASGWLLRGLVPDHHDDENYVIVEAAVAYLVYTPEVLHPVEVFADDEAHLETWLGQRLGVILKVPKLADVGHALVGGRLLSSEYGLGAMLMYEAPSGERVVLYACRDKFGHRPTALRFAHHDEVSVFYWFDGTLSYAVAAQLGRADLQEIARSAYSDMVASADG